jgi:uncharacterized SAM-binding protein YcdF (DUF218 family)
MSRAGLLNDETAARLELAVQLEAHSPSAMIVLCGWAYRSDTSLTIADAMRAYMNANHPDLMPKVKCQRYSRDTVGDAIFSRLLIDSYPEPAGITVKVVTSDYHVIRATEIFRYVFGDQRNVSVFGAPSRLPVHHVQSEVRSLAAFRNTFAIAKPGDLASIYASLRESHPYYNGEIYPKIDKIGQLACSFRLDSLP